MIVTILSLLTSAQVYTNVTTTLTDSSTQAWANASYRAELVPPFGNPGVLNNQGVAPITPISGFANASGTFVISLDDNTVMQPSGSTWRFTLCPNATVSVCSVSIQVIHGASMNLSASISADLTPVHLSAAPFNSRAYNDNEVSSGQGGLYWRVTDNTLRGYDGTTWQNIGGNGPGVIYTLLATCAGGIEGTTRAVIDANTNTWGATILGGGSNHILAYCNGTNWTVAAK